MSAMALVWTAIGGCTILLFVLYGYVVLAKRRWLRAGRFVEDRLEAIEAALQRNADAKLPLDALVAMAAKHRAWRVATQDFLARRAALGGTDEEVERTRALARACFADAYRRGLTAGRWSERMNAIGYIALFRLEEFWPELAWALNDERRTQPERMLALRALATLQRVEAIDFLAASPKGLTDHDIRHALMPLGEGVLHRCCVSFDNFAPWVQTNILDVLRVRNIRDEATLRLFERALRSDSVELRIRAMKGIANFGTVGEEAEEAFLARMVDWRGMHWSEKLMAARWMGAIPNDRYPPLLEQMLEDAHHAVRYQAMQSLMEYPGRRARLERLSAAQSDRFAGVLAQEMMERYGYERHRA
ncbi:hypothetical protein [Paenibacillus sp.]|uniref:HEAT repeat domain-containing protein n=1 Tax=Paenibacillus sp. TaxID=58172 RepID=UPI002D42C184|nr:hypothetical protein [Paenibacillus sp.]HZG56072.1 hypothetical protein [Paenibacillus sp.]